MILMPEDPQLRLGALEPDYSWSVSYSGRDRSLSVALSRVGTTNSFWISLVEGRAIARRADCDWSKFNNYVYEELMRVADRGIEILFSRQ